MSQILFGRIEMFGMFKKKPPQHVFKIEYCNCASIDADMHIVSFDIDPKWMREAFVIATDKSEASAEFAKKAVLYPHVYIHNITQVNVAGGDRKHIS